MQQPETQLLMGDSYPDKWVLVTRSDSPFLCEAQAWVSLGLTCDAEFQKAVLEGSPGPLPCVCMF